MDIEAKMEQSTLSAVEAIVSAIKDSNKDVVIPEDRVREIHQGLAESIHLYGLDIRSDEIMTADDQLRDEYGEDWLTYRDDRLEELNNERNSLRKAS